MPVTVTSSWTTSPGWPVTVFVNVQVAVSFGASVSGRPLPAVAPLQSMSAIAAGWPLPTLSTKPAASSVTESVADVFFTVTVNLTGPPGSETLVGDGVFVTSIDDGTSVISTFAVSVSLTEVFSSS